MKVNGNCHCGKIEFKATIDPQKVVICHCTDCQSMSGTAFRTVAMTEPDAFEFTQGNAKSYFKKADSGNTREQTFCPDCGSPFYSVTVGDGPKVFAIRVGVIEQRDQLEPRKQIWCNSSQNWLENIESYPRSDEQ